MDDLLRKKAELILVYSVPLLSNARENSRLAGLQRHLQKEVIKPMKNIVGFTNKEFNEIIQKVLAWGKDTGWLEDAKHTGTLVAFCSDIVENSPFTYPPGILKTLREIALHLEDHGELLDSSCPDGAVAAEKWEKLFKPKEDTYVSHPVR